MGVVRRWERARTAAVIGECGHGQDADCPCGYPLPRRGEAPYRAGDALWRQIQAEPSRVLPAAARDPEPVEDPRIDPTKNLAQAVEPPLRPPASLLIFGSRPSASRL